MIKDILLGKTLAELTEIVKTLGLPKFTAKQITDWLYTKNISSIDEMSNLSKKTRQLLSDKFELGFINHSNVQTSKDGTKKYLFPTVNQKYIESAYIPDETRNTLCISTQVGCKMGCSFCMTGKQGFQANLSSGEIINQIKNFPEANTLTNIVYMGMGEPLDNIDEVMKSLEILTSEWGFAMSPKRITVSTIGVIPAMKRFLEESNCHLAVSLHTPFDHERKKIMPVQKVYPINEVLEEIKNWDFTGQRRVSFEYIMFKDFNDQQRHVDELARILNGINCRINLIHFHPIPDTDLKGTEFKQIEVFKEALTRKGIITTIRRSRGKDIFAACGLLSTKELNKTVS